jgi:6-phosphogluconolactonase
MEGSLSTGGEDLSGRAFVLSSPEELARAAAGRLWGIARERAMVLGRTGKEAKGVSIALSGGNTPRLVLTTLSSEPYRSRFPWNLVHFYQVDERWVPPGDPSSNQRMLRESLVSRAPIPPDRFHPVDTALPTPREGARRYEETLRHSFRVKTGGFPRFDAILLGMGADGHIASLFPGSPALEEESAWVVESEGGDPHVPRVTLTLPVLNAASHIFFLVSGKGKARVLEEVLSGRGAALPASRVSPRRGKVTFLADAAAGSRPEKKIPPDNGAGVQG